ncbi:uncharacterized protein LOC107370234 [Tetranychus urticae]|uniref:uncharacterized protein LOC107370234 n=1 Tax=Tetranychus urticae TaxID=32264 RepID=UPI00077B8895|nr:uncharacterized protein LOC107370234 [Tetranychus urticae]
MNISFYILLLFVVSTCVSKLQPKPLDSSIGASGIQSSSSVNSTNVETLPIPYLIRKTRSITNSSFRTLVIQRRSETCFSKYPVKMCNPGESALQTESKKIELVCIEKNRHAFVQILAEESKKRIVTEVIDLYKTETYTYHQPTKCSN